MSTIALPLKVTTLAQAVQQIRRYREILVSSSILQARLSQTHVWYALKVDDDWFFAPSKFLRREFGSEADYLAPIHHKEIKSDGGRTEKLLDNWFSPVQVGTQLELELSERLADFLKRYGKRRRGSDEIKVLNEFLEARNRQLKPVHPGTERIVSDPRICGGRPIIKGTRIRVADILDMLASGATHTEILEDFDYLTKEDLAAALSYAAREIDHRIFRAA